MQKDSTMSLYIHIPLCVSKCAYCDFVSFSGRMAQRERYVTALCQELRMQAKNLGKRKIRTVFFGGGTPTLLKGEQIQAIMDTVRTCFEFEEGAEVTMEGNPGTLSMENLLAYREAGVNRLSLGVQSLDDGLLRAIGRIHTAQEAVGAVKMARDAGFKNLNLDLMYGLPGQTAEQWKETLTQAIELAPEHLSCYSLILEEGTPLYEAVENGRGAKLPDDDTLAEMDRITAEMTAVAGYVQYEVSNYAKEGRTCRHNQVYWECLPYLGVGLNAHSDLDGKRFYHTADWDTYLDQAERDEMKHEQEGEGSQKERMFERMMMGLRQVRGVDRIRFKQDFGEDVRKIWPKTIEEMEQKGLMVCDEKRMSLTARGMQVMNGVLVALMEEEH